MSTRGAAVTIDYHDRRFRCVANNATGDVGDNTLFHYRQVGCAIWATYEGGSVAHETMVGVRLDDGRLDLRYQHVTHDGILRTGRCVSTPDVLGDGRLRLCEAWMWTEGGIGSGASEVEEIPVEPVATPMATNRQSSEHYTWGGECQGWRLLARSDLGVTLERMPPRTAERPHLHRRARQLFFVLDGQLRVDRPMGSVDVPAESALEVPPGQVHAVRNTENADAIFLVVSAPSTQADRMDVPRPVLQPRAAAADAPPEVA